MMKLVFATHNEHKIKEIKSIGINAFKIISLIDLQLKSEIPETGSTLKENALIKAKYITENFNLNVFADDSGLEVEVLNGAPGVFSARYAGEPKNDKKNIVKLLQELAGESYRKARFRTVIALILEGKEYLFEGIIEGQIATEKRGTKGFGYDPIFIPEGETRTFAEMSLDEKNKTSHRAIAVKKLVEFLDSKI